MTNGIVVQFRRGRHTIKERHFLIEIEKVKTKIRGAHGNKGVVRAIFEKGLPGQAITTKVEIKWLLI